MAKKRKVDNDAFLSIDLNSLETEWQGQPKLYFRWSKKLARARRHLDEAEAALELCKGDLDSEIRGNPKKYGLHGKDEDKPPTESAIKHTIQVQEEYTDAVKAVNDARYDVNVLQAGVVSLEHRKRALENEVELFGMDYFSVPRAGKRGKDAKHKMDKDAARRGYRRRGDDD